MTNFTKNCFKMILSVWLCFLAPICIADSLPTKENPPKMEKSILFKLYEASIREPSHVDAYLKENDLLNDEHLLSCFNTRKKKIKELLSEDELKRADWCRKEAPSYTSETCSDPFVKLYNWFFSMEKTLTLEKKWLETNYGQFIFVDRYVNCHGSFIFPGMGGGGRCAAWLLLEDYKIANYVDLLSCP